MKKFKKFLVMGLTVVMAFCIMNVGVLAEQGVSGDKIQFVTTDEDGNITEISDLIYIDEIAEMYNNSKNMRWISTTYYNLGNGAFTISGGSVYTVQSGRHFNCNSNGRIYYHGETTGRNAVVSLYDITNDRYVGSFTLLNEGNGTYRRLGYFSGLSTNIYYSVGLAGDGGNVSSYYATISWNEL